MTQTLPGRIPPVFNSPDKIQLARLSYVHASHPDLDTFSTFALDFGFVIESKDADNLYLRGYGRDKCCYVATRSQDGEKHFHGAAYLAKTESDFRKTCQLPGASPVSENPPACGGGSRVTLSSPSGTVMHVVWGAEERPAPVKPESSTEIHKGGFNTALQKTRKGEFQRFKLGPAMVHKLGHYGYITTMFDEDVAFYTQNFNFVPSDVLYETDESSGTETDALTFMHLDQGAEYSDHHTLFLNRAPPGFDTSVRNRMHHCSFEVEDFDTQLLGHEYLLTRGYTPIWGVGRHIYGSQIFDYWRDPSGFAIEHYADGDLVNAENPTGREKSDGPASMYIWGPVRPAGGVAS
ncbi:glyoxalase family protein [Echria macrotheca]|uniref:Glyoxalase family protein n=1 Tax=Echria macrotheca TaxID=438768 RepID=A0AAJ0B4D6_9PEZI|nr:glyoxalase family protein [Echria macrotheca]